MDKHYLKEVNPSDYQAIYFAGHGAIWDLRNNKELNDIALSIYNNQGVLCHGAAGLLDIKENGDYLVRHKDVTGFTNSEEQANGTTEYMPYLLEDEFISNGAHLKRG